ncbi:hypothetical protein KGM_204402 [Danaus plexippus plexippus]|uniref:Uncharacterized protein n=1 Tax=Danaus plexippus plexippus TaxID=278856 RepID=A0A212F3Y2_DANPL|nr:hypothetical protein KGM_204402 [Danaus plexippus plexippus]
MCGGGEGARDKASSFQQTSYLFSLACDMKGRDSSHASRCSEKCITMNSRLGLHVMGSGIESHPLIGGGGAPCSAHVLARTPK